MENKEKNLTALESLEVIERMIDSTRENYGKQRSFYYLFWGWLILAAIVVQYALLHSKFAEYNFLPWPILMPLGMVVSLVYANKDRQKEKNETYLSHFFGVFFSTGSLLFIVGVFICVSNNISPNPLVMLISGVYGIVAGRLLKFKPFIFGGIVFVLLSIAANYVGGETQLLMLAIGIVTGYLIPGYLLRSKSKENAATA